MRLSEIPGIRLFASQSLPKKKLVAKPIIVINRILHRIAKPYDESINKEPKISEAAAFVENLTGNAFEKPKILWRPRVWADVFCFSTIDGKTTRTGAVRFINVHELTHIHDLNEKSPVKNRLAPGEDKLVNPFNPINRMFLEGRATFAETLFNLRNLGWTPDFARIFNIPFAMTCLGGWMTFFSDKAADAVTKSNLMLIGLIERLNEAGLNVPGNAYVDPGEIARQGKQMIAIGLVYWLYHNALCTLAKKIGDPVKAFRISGEKIPRTLMDVLRPSKFYKEEIAKAQNEKTEQET